MTDTERLNLIEHYEWDILHHTCQIEPWRIFGKFGKTEAYKTLREAINAALTAQFKWSTGA